MILRFIQQHWKLFTLSTLLAITLLSLLPIQTLPKVEGSDKSHHLIAYFFLALPLGLRKPKKSALFVCLFIIFGGLIEIIQPYMNRHNEWLDFFASSTGVIFGFYIGVILKAKLSINQ